MADVKVRKIGKVEGGKKAKDREGRARRKKTNAR